MFKRKAGGNWYLFTIVRSVEWRLNNFLVVKATSLNFSYESYEGLEFYQKKKKSHLFCREGSDACLPAECIKNSLKFYLLLIVCGSTTLLLLFLF